MIFNSSNNNNNDDDDNSKPHSGGSPPPPPTFSYFPGFFQSNQAPSAPTQQLSPYVFPKPTFQSSQQQRNAFDRFSTTPTGPGEQVMSKIESVVEKARHEEEVEQKIPGDPLLEYFGKADENLKTDFVLQKEKEKADIENFKKEYEIDTLTEQIDQGKLPQILEVYFGRESKNFLQRVKELKPNEETTFFIDFLMTDFGSRLMKENNLSIHVDTGDLYYNGVNTGESIYNFVLSQKDFSKK